MANKTVEKSEYSEDNLIQQLITKYLPYWPLFVLAMLLGAGLAYTYVRYKTPLYQAKATILINDGRKGAEGSKLTESINLTSAKQLIENEIEILGSRRLMDNVVKEHHLYAPIFTKGRVHYVSAYNSSPVRIVTQNTDSLKPAKNILFTYDKSAKQVTVNKSQKYKLDEFVSTPWGLLKFVPNPAYENDKSDNTKNEYYFSLIGVDNATTFEMNNLEVVTANKFATLVELRLKDELPKKAEAILNSLLKEYSVDALKSENEVAKNTLESVEKRLADVGKQMDSIQRKVESYKTGSNAVNISTQGELALRNVSENDQKLSTLNSRISVLSKVEGYVNSKSNSGSIVPSTSGIEDPMLSQMLDKLYSNELEYDKLKTTYGENHPTVTALADEIKKIKPNIRENIQSQKQSLLATKSIITSTNGQYNSMINSMPQKEKELLEINRNANTLDGVYQYLLQKKEETILSFTTAVPKNKIIDNAFAANIPVSPKKNLIYGGVIFGTLALFMFFIALREFLTGKVLYRKEIENMTSWPVIAEVCQDKQKRRIIVEPGKRTFGTEEFRKIRSSLSYLGVDSKHKKVLITSSLKGEGKSFVSANLAISVASAGKKTILVDMDFNNPTIGKILKIKSDKGVVDYLQDDVGIDDIITKVDEYENLYYISAGSRIDGPSELLANGKVKGLIDYLENKFDRVLIDTSPVVLITDAYTLSPLCDTTLYVVRHKYTPKMIIKRIDENNLINPIHNPGIVFNGVRGRGIFRNSYGRGYGYGYVYDLEDDNKGKSKIKFIRNKVNKS